MDINFTDILRHICLISQNICADKPEVFIPVVIVLGIIGAILGAIWVRHKRKQQQKQAEQKPK